MLERTPLELRQCPQWFLWRAVWLADKHKWTKVPVSPNTAKAASVQNRADWSSFDHSAQVYTTYGASHKLNGLSFALGHDSGTSGIDLDDVFDAEGNVLDYNALAIVEKFDSYTEYSPSRTGLHILFKGNVPSGRRHAKVEVYSTGRFFTVTGDVYLDRPLRERQAMADELVAAIDAKRQRALPGLLDWHVDGTVLDGDLWDMAARADNGEKFQALWNGNWQDRYGSQSEADFALIDILAFYTDSPQQVSRLFMASALGQREKARERLGYVVGMIARSFDRKAPKLDLSAVVAQVAAGPTVAAVASPHGHSEALTPDDAEYDAELASDPFTLPPGLVGEVAQFVYAQSVYPMKEASLASALVLLAGIAGRQYQFNGKGLNLYMLVIANTGSGKEAMSTGIGKIMDAVCSPRIDPTLAPSKENVGKAVGYPAARGFRGPAELTGKGILRTFSSGATGDTLSCFSILNEFAYVLQQMADPRNSNAGMVQLKRALLDLYMKSSEGNAYAGSTTAEKDNDIKSIMSPAFSILCESTPKKFYECLNEDLIADGMLPRMVLFESKGFGEYNRDHAKVEPSANLVLKVTQLCMNIFKLKQSSDMRFQIQATPDGAERSEAFRAYARERLKSSGSESVRELWNRAHLNAERIAALVAIGVDPYNPIVTAEHIQWAARLITRQIVLLTAKFQRGEVGIIGNDEQSQHSDILRALNDFKNMVPGHVPRGYIMFEDARKAGVVPYAYLHRRCAALRSFKHDRRGSTVALKAMLDVLIKTGVLSPARVDGKHWGQCYTLGS